MTNLLDCNCIQGWNEEKEFCTSCQNLPEGEVTKGHDHRSPVKALCLEHFPVFLVAKAIGHGRNTYGQDASYITIQLKEFISSLLQAQRKKDAEIVKKLIKKETPTHGGCCICQGCGSDKDQCWCTVNLWLDAASKEILNQSNDE